MQQITFHRLFHKLFLLLGSIVGLSFSLHAQGEEPIELVNPLIDAANSRWFFFSSACRPFGMVNLSPDNLQEGTWGTGYRYNVDTIRGFSHIHAWQLSGISVMPLATEVDGREGTAGICLSFFARK